MSILGRQFGSKHTARWRLDLRLLGCELRTMYVFFCFSYNSFEPCTSYFCFIQIWIVCIALSGNSNSWRVAHDDAWPTMVCGSRWFWLPMARGPWRRVAPDGAWPPKSFLNLSCLMFGSSFLNLYKKFARHLDKFIAKASHVKRNGQTDCRQRCFINC